MSQPVVSQAVWRVFLAGRRADVLDATVTAVLPFGALVTVGPGFPGCCRVPRGVVTRRPGTPSRCAIVDVDDHVRRLSFAAA